MDAGDTVELTVEITVHAPRLFGNLVLTVPCGPPLRVQGTPRARSLPWRLLCAWRYLSLVAELLSLLWAHESAKERLCVGGQWWPEEVAVTFCDGGKKDESTRLAADAELSTLGPVVVAVLHVERALRRASDALPLKRMRPNDWRAVQSMPPGEAVARIRRLPYGIEEKHLNADNYCRKRTAHFANGYRTQVPDLRSSYATAHADAPATPAAAVLVVVPSLLPSIKQAGFKLHRKGAGGDGACRELAGGRVVHVREVLTEGGVSEATEAAMGATYDKLGNQPTGHRLLSRKQQNQRLQAVIRDRAVQLRAARCEVRWYTFLLTLPQCPEQKRHLDHKDPRVWSMIIGLGVNRRLVWFGVGGELIPVFVGRGEAVFFQGNVCHYGGASTTPCGCPARDRCRWVEGQVEADLRCLELGLHAYVVMEDEGGAEFD